MLAPSSFGYAPTYSVGTPSTYSVGYPSTYSVGTPSTYSVGHPSTYTTSLLGTNFHIPSGPAYAQPALSTVSDYSGFYSGFDTVYNGVSGVDTSVYSGLQDDSFVTEAKTSVPVKPVAPVTPITPVAPVEPINTGIFHLITTKID